MKIPSLISLVALFSLSFFIFLPANAQNAQRKVKVVFYVDQSESMKDHLKKVADLLPLIAHRIERSCGSFNFAVANLFYADLEPYRQNFDFFGDPEFITEQMPFEEAIALLGTRLLNPQPENISKGLGPVFRAGREMTYSTISRSVQHNITSLSDADLVVALVITDAAPLVELETPEKEVSLVRSMLGSKFMSAVIGHREEDLKNTVCIPDVPDVKTPVSHYDGLYQFAKASNGYMWNICQEDYSWTIEDFLSLVIEKAQCGALMM